MSAFFAFNERNPPFSYECRDEASGVLGSIDPKAPPILEAQDAETLELRARAHLGVEPGDRLYLTDSRKRVLKILINTKHHHAVELREKLVAKVAALLVFAVTALIAATLGPVRLPSLSAFVSAAILYLAVVRTKFLNEVEAAIVCEVLLLVGMIFVLAARMSH